ncbi:MAG: riboflavin biosynthesis protein RibF [Polyangiaceae bacterium]|jgi:riboflavin kinase/FMN adenylyltransferase|nr:riboflavin biosynthesis protein RibF [Polyangiaceae bacterium]MBK8939453.1 riboflavin biosynthesis protein RibF [Polyangiaceae bacterium]
MGALVVIGNFDGVHRGHREVLEGAVLEAETLGLEPRLLTFSPHPAAVLGRRPPALLTNQRRKRELVQRVSPRIQFDEERFDLAYAAQSPEEFARRLRDSHEARRVVVGKNFRFGKGREGDFERLVELGAALGFSARYESIRGDARGAWSSTRARAAIAAGDLEEVLAVLGRPHALSGTVVRGKQLGRTLGFPTCNLANVAEAPVPFGVYAVTVDQVTHERARALGRGAMSVGTNPTTDGDSSVKVEVYLLDLDLDLYGAELRVHVLERLRGEERFDSLEALVQQMHDDVARARAITSKCQPDPQTSAFG